MLQMMAVRSQGSNLSLNLPLVCKLVFFFCVDLIFNGFESFPSFMELSRVCEHKVLNQIFLAC